MDNDVIAPLRLAKDHVWVFVGKRVLLPAEGDTSELAATIGHKLD